MRILYVINDLSSGGAEKLVDEIVPLLNRNSNLEVELLLLQESKSVYLNIEQNNIKVIRLNVKNIYNPFIIFKIKKIINRGKYDIVHAHLFPSLYWVALANIINFKNRVKLIYTEHSVTNKRRTKPIFNSIERFIYSQYDKIVCISEAVHTELINWLKIKGSRKDDFYTIYNGINIRLFEEAVEYKKEDICEGYQEGDILLCMVARFVESKDHDTLIRSLHELPSHIKLILVGGGPREIQIKNLLQEYNLKNRVIFLGERNDIPEILKTIDIMIVSSNWEGFGLTAVEGMAAGKIVLASDVPGLNEVIRDKDMLFKKGDERQLTHLVLKILSNKMLYKEKQLSSLKNAKKFSLDEMTENYIKLYLSEVYE